jgi:hypothetical protein
VVGEGHIAVRVCNRHRVDVYLVRRRFSGGISDRHFEG